MPVKGYDKLIAQVNKMLQADRVMTAAVNTVLAEQKKRIHQDGRDSSNNPIGKYSTKPIHISRKRQSRNTGKTFFPGGYREYKALTGKATSGSVVLRDTDQMMMDLGTHVLGRMEYGIGYSNPINKQKADWMEQKYGKDIFSSTQEEDDLLIRVMEFELRKIE